MSDGFTDTNPNPRQSLGIMKKSWENLFKVIRQSDIKSEGNFWAAIQELERQFEMKNPSIQPIENEKGELELPRKGIICFKCNGTFNHEFSYGDDYQTIADCPHCGAKNSVRY